MKIARWMTACVVLTAVAVGTAPSSASIPPDGTSIARPGNSYQPGNAYTQYPFLRWDYDHNAGDVVDNPVSIVFVSTRPDMVTRVYSQIAHAGLPNGNNSQQTLKGYGPSLPGQASSLWTSVSTGRKTPNGCNGQCGSTTDIHLRTYGHDGSQGTQVYQTQSYPYYLLATVHEDINDGKPGATYGYQQAARSWLVTRMVNAGYWTVSGTLATSNACHGWFDSSHYCDFDGKAQRIVIG